jgi:glycosyltransferase involved in cell wall biosynthesis
MQSSPLISIIIPVYNTEKYLKQCINSVLSQTFTDFELILVDDGSKDSSPDICEQYAQSDDRIRVIHQKNSGVSAARNTGLNHAQGQNICFIDADDWVENDFLSTLYSNKCSSNADIVFCNIKIVYGERIDLFIPYDSQKSTTDIPNYLSKTGTYVYGCIFSKQIVGDQRFPHEIHLCEDLYFMARLLSKCKHAVNCYIPLYNYRQWDGSVTRNITPELNSEMLKCLDSTLHFFSNYPDYNEFQKVFAWRTLSITIQLALSTNSFRDFIEKNKANKAYVMNNPLLGLKMKIFIWCLLHNLQPMGHLILFLGRLSGRCN